MGMDFGEYGRGCCSRMWRVALELRMSLDVKVPAIKLGMALVQRICYNGQKGPTMPCIHKNGGQHRMGSSDYVVYGERGFNARVNLFIIRYLYGKMKKADRFMVPGKGKRKKSIDISEFIGFDDQRLDRVRKGENFRLAPSDTTVIAECFNIDREYFQEKGKLMEVHGIVPEDWKSYFLERNSAKGKGKDGEHVEEPSEWQPGYEKVKRKLDELVSKGYIEGNYSKQAPIYRIHYFFEKGEVYREPSRLDIFLESLERLEISDWKQIADRQDDMKECLELLKKHYEYVSAYVRCRDIEEGE